MSLINGQSSGSSNASGMKDLLGNNIPLWNYSSATDKEGKARADFCQEITGTVIDIKEVQATKYQSNELEWGDKEQTQPKLDIEMAINVPNKGNVVWHFKPGSVSKYDKFSIARKAVVDAIRAYYKDPATNDMEKVIGMNVTVSTNDLVTQDGKVIPYGAGNPRPWNFKINGEGDKSLVIYGQTPAAVPAQDASDPQAVAENPELYPDVQF